MSNIGEIQKYNLADALVAELDAKRTIEDSYSKTETDDLLSSKAAKDTVYTKVEVDDLLSVATESYSKQEIDDKITALKSSDYWKNPVQNFSNIATLYPAPEHGWLVLVIDENRIYMYSSTTATWEKLLDIATETQDGLMSKEYVIKLNDTYTKSEADQKIADAVAASGDMTKEVYDMDGDGIVDLAKALDGCKLSASQINGFYDDTTALNNTIYTQVIPTFEAINTSIQTLTSKSHEHTNLEVLSKLTEDPSGGGLLYNNAAIGGGDGDMLKSVYDMDDDGIVDKAKALDGCKLSPSQINGFYDDTKALNDRVTNEVIPAFETINSTLDAISPKAHTHDNKETLDKFSSTPDGKLLYNNEEIANEFKGDMTKAVYDTNGDGSVDKADTLNGLTVTVSDLNKAHDHTNKDVLNKFDVTVEGIPTYEGKELVNKYNGDMTKAVYDTDGDGIIDKAKTIDGLTVTVSDLNKAHEHTNKTVLDKLSESDTGKLLYNNEHATGDMAKDVYDADNDGIVDKAKTLDGLTVTVDDLNNVGHTHTNKDVIDNFSEVGGDVYYKDKNITNVTGNLVTEGILQEITVNNAATKSASYVGNPTAAPDNAYYGKQNGVVGYYSTEVTDVEIIDMVNSLV